LHNRYSDEMIMEAYLNTISLSERLAGVEAGAQTYFGKTVSELTLAECATIAGITRAPTYYSPYQNPENCLTRRDDVIFYMQEVGYITDAQAQEVWDMPTLGLLDWSSQLSSNSGATSAGVFSYFTDKAYEDVLRDLQNLHGLTYAEARRSLYNDGLRIYLTVDLNVQGTLDKLMVNGYQEGGFFTDTERFPDFMSRMTIREDVENDLGQIIGTQEVLPQMGVAVINYKGELVATSGGIGEKTTSLSLNRSIGTLRRDADGELILSAWGEPVVQGTLRQPGSSMKPIAAYALGIDRGIITYSKTVMDAPILSRDPYNPKRDPETNQVVLDWPYNYGGEASVRHEKIPVVSAVAESTNTVAAQVGKWVGREQMFEFLRDVLEITSLIEPNDVDLAPLVLGASTYGLSAYEMAGAYMMFGGDETYGRHTTLHCYTRVEDPYGNIVLEPEIMTQQAVNPQSGYVMNRLLQNVVGGGSYPAGSRPASPTAGGMALAGEMPSAGKTGTTNEDKDRWFVGLTPYYVTAVWWGYDREHDLLAQGSKGWPAGGRRNPTINMWKALMEEVQADYEVKDFPGVPEGVRTLSFCTISGGLALPGCPTMTGYYTSDAIPEPCPGHGLVEEEIPPA
jgi:penicillin-binding protein 1A